MTTTNKISMFTASIFAAIGGLLLSVERTNAATLNIANPGFEDPVLVDGDFNIARPNSQTIPGWQVTSFLRGGNAGVFNPSDTAYAGASIPSSLFEVTHGQNVAYTNGFAIQQILPDVLLPNTLYTFSVDVGRRLDVSFPSGGAFIELFAGSNLLASLDPISAPSNGNFITKTLKYASSSNSELVGQNLKIRLGNNSSPFDGQVNFDNVKLSATAIPEPSSVMSLLALSTIGIAVHLMKRNRKSATSIANDA